jgi:hypothetical protein
MSKDICAVMSNIDSFHSCTVGSDFGFNGVSITVRPPAPSLLAMVPASAMAPRRFVWNPTVIIETCR